MSGKPPVLLDPSRFAGSLGIELVAWSEERAEISMPVTERLLNRNGSVHGGAIMSLLDTACSFAGLTLVDGELKGRVVMASLTVNFVAPANGTSLRAVAAKRGGGRRMFMVMGEAFDDHGRLVATASGVGRYVKVGEGE